LKIYEDLAERLLHKIWDLTINWVS